MTTAVFTVIAVFSIAVAFAITTVAGTGTAIIIAFAVTFNVTNS